MVIREKYEWAQLWWEEADNALVKRVLLIGDSITVGYRPYVQEKLKEKFLVDMLSTSKSIDDPSFIKELNYILNEYQYTLIHFNNGLHGNHVSDDDYESFYKRVLKILKDKCNNVILVTSTPVTVVGDGEQLDIEADKRVNNRNVIVKKLAQENNLKVNDLYDEFYNKFDYRCGDGYHYNDLGKKAQGEIVAENILYNVIL